MTTEKHAVRPARAFAIAIALIVPAIATPVATAYADNETPAAIEPPYRALASDPAQPAASPPALRATGDVLGAGGQIDERARTIYRPGVSDR